MMSHKIPDSVGRLHNTLECNPTDRIFFITDSNVNPFSLPYLEECAGFAPVNRIVIPAGEANKNPSTLLSICSAMSRDNATRQSIVVNMGGGMVSDIGGFAASIFKRGIRYLNLSSTLLGAVDASIGGKTGVDFNPSEYADTPVLKNELGAFHLPLASIPLPELFPSLPHAEFLSGLGEVMKTAMLACPDIYTHLLSHPDFSVDSPLISDFTSRCASFKQEITTADPTERGIRRILNLGHTAGHAIESLLLSRFTPLPHGVCVAHGLLISLIVSHLKAGIQSETIYQYRDWLREVFPKADIICADVPKLCAIMTHDKKNTSADKITFMVLSGIGGECYPLPISANEIAEALDIFVDIS